MNILNELIRSKLDKRSLHRFTFRKLALLKAFRRENFRVVKAFRIIFLRCGELVDVFIFYGAEPVPSSGAAAGSDAS